MKKSKHRFYSFFIRLWFAAWMAMQGILVNPLRSALTILGVAIGVTSVVSLMGIGEGARIAVVKQFESLGANVITVKAQHTSAEFDHEFAYELMERVDGLKWATPVTYAKAMLKWRRTRGNIDVIGVNGDYPQIRDHKVIRGHFFTELHVKQRLPVAVLGYNTAAGFSQSRNLVGSTLTLGERTYTIIGILAPKGAGNAEEIDNKIVIPYTCAQKIAEKKTIEEIWAKAASKSQADLAMVQMSRIIKSKLGLRQNAFKPQNNSQPAETGSGQPGESGQPQGGAVELEEAASEQPAADEAKKPEIVGDDLVTITNLNQLVDEADNANRVMTLLLGGIAAVSLLVGGLGIMNIMMVSVNERTEEIGVRRALGAKHGDLLLQFVLEALYVSVIGSIVGIVAGIWGLGLFERMGFETAVSFQSVKIATIVALSSGLLFGVYPAVSASSVPPVEALRRQ